MEVLQMGRRNRLSRGLIGILAVTVALGLVFYFHNTSKSKAAQDKSKLTSSAQAPAAAKETANPLKGAMVTSAPKAENPLSPTGLDKKSGAAPAIKPATQPAATPTIAKAKPFTPISGTPLADAKAKIDANDLLGARRLLSAALVAGSFSESDAAQAKSMLDTISATVVFSPQRFADDEYGGTYNVQPGELLTKIAQQH